MKSKLLLWTFAFFLIASYVNAFETNGKLIDTYSANGITVDWYGIETDFIHQEYDVSVTSNVITQQDINPFIDSLINLDSVSNLNVYELGSETIQEPIYVGDCSKYYSKIENGTEFKVPICEKKLKETKEYKVDKWNKIEAETSKVRSIWNVITFGWLDKDGTKLNKKLEQVVLNNTKRWYKIVFDVKAGTSGRVGFEINGDIFHPWFNTSFMKKESVQANKIKKIWLLNISKSASMNANYSDLRFANSSESGELNYWIWSYGADTAQVYVNNYYNDTTIYMYYGNDTVTSKSDMELTGLQPTENTGKKATFNTTKWSRTELNGGAVLRDPGIIDCAGGGTCLAYLTSTNKIGWNYTITYGTSTLDIPTQETYFGIMENSDIANAGAGAVNAIYFSLASETRLITRLVGGADLTRGNALTKSYFTNNDNQNTTISFGHTAVSINMSVWTNNYNGNYIKWNNESYGNLNTSDLSLAPSATYTDYVRIGGNMHGIINLTYIFTQDYVPDITYTFGSEETYVPLGFVDLINFTTYPANTSIKSYSIDINATAWINETNGQRGNISFLIFRSNATDGWKINISNLTGGVSMPNATNFLFNSIGNKLIFPYNLTNSDYLLGDVFIFGIYGCMDDTHCVQYNSSNVTIINTLGSISIILNPSTKVNSTNSINGSLTYNGINTATIRTYWYKESNVIYGVNYSGIATGITISNILDEANYTHYENVTMEAYINNGIESDAVNSSTVYIYNVAPTTPTQITPTNGSVTLMQNKTLRCSNSIDPEGDTIYYKFENDTSLMQNSTSQYYNWTYYLNSTYYWKCSANDLNLSSADSTLWQFYYRYIILGINGTGYPFLNFTFYRELNPVDNITGKLEALFYLWMNNDINDNVTLNLSTNNVSYLALDLGFTPNDTIVTGNAQINYESDNYEKRQFYYYNYTFSNNTKQQKLFLLEYPTLYSFTTTFYIDVKYGSSLVDNAIISIDKKYLGEGIYRTIGMRKTDDIGNFIEYLDLNQDYQFYVIWNGMTYGPYYKTALCSVTPCSLSLQLWNNTNNLYEGYEEIFAGNIISNLSYNSSSQMVYYNFTDITSTAHYFRLLVGIGSLNDTSKVVCDVTNYTTYGRLECNVTGYTGDFFATSYISRSPEKIDKAINFVIGGLSGENGWGLLGLLGCLALIVTITIVFGAISQGNPTVILVGFGISILLCKLCTIWPFGWVSVSVLEVLILWLASKVNT